MTDYLSLSEQTARRAQAVLAESDLFALWRRHGAEPHLVGSLRMGLMMMHRDIDLHIYSERLDTASSFAVVAKLAEHPACGRITCLNLMREADACIQWQVAWRDAVGDDWVIDLIHMQHGSPWEGHFERMADRIRTLATPEERLAILRLKYETPVTEHVPGIAYYMAVLRDGIRSQVDFDRWRAAHPLEGIVEWMP